MKSFTLACARTWVVALALAASGCATLTQGTSQSILVQSDPEGAACTLTRDGETLASITTPAPVKLKRSDKPIRVSCAKDGYEEGITVLHARWNTASGGNALLGGPIGMMIDQSSGAGRQYELSVKVELSPLSAADRAATAAGRP